MLLLLVLLLLLPSLRIHIDTESHSLTPKDAHWSHIKLYWPSPYFPTSGAGIVSYCKPASISQPRWRIRCMCVCVCVLVGHSLDTIMQDRAKFWVAWESGGMSDCLCSDWRMEERRGVDVFSHGPTWRRLRWREAVWCYLMAKKRSWRMTQSVNCCSARWRCWVISEQMARTASGSATIVLRTCIFCDVKSNPKAFFPTARSQGTAAVMTRDRTWHCGIIELLPEKILFVALPLLLSAVITWCSPM